jgi:phosphoribosylanthranilate isomerase
MSTEFWRVPTGCGSTGMRLTTKRDALRNVSAKPACGRAFRPEARVSHRLARAGIGARRARARRPPLIVQIYEIQTPDEAEAMIALGVDHVGSVLLADREWLQPLLRETVRMIQRAGRRSSLIPLSCDPDAIARALDYYAPDLVHFCETIDADGIPGAEARVFARQAALRDRFPQIAMMRSIPIPCSGSRADEARVLELARRFAPISDFFLTDTLLRGAGTRPSAPQPVEGYVGITGRTCDWDIAARLVEDSRLPVVLAGGLSPDNVRRAVLRVRPAGVDSCTRTNRVGASGEALRFCKDPRMVEAFVRQARAGVQDAEPMTL